MVTFMPSQAAAYRFAKRDYTDRALDDTIMLMNKLTQTALAVGAAVVVTGVGVLSVRHYEQYKKLRDHANQVTAQQVAKAKASQEAFQVQLVAKYNALVGECQKGVVAYNALSPTVKVKVPAPSCSAQLAQ